MSVGSAVPLPRWELAAENIAVKIRWLGLALGYLYVNMSGPVEHQTRLNAILAVGLGFTILDTYFSLRGRVFLRRYPLAVSSMEALFIGLLCYYHGGLASWFHYYYFLSLVCCAIRHSASVTYATCALHCCSVGLLYLALGPERRDAFSLLLSVLVLNWVTWAASSMARLIKRVGDYLGQLNAALRENQALLEARIAQRTQELHEAQAQVLHQEKMAAFGLLAAGIAHEVGNPLTSISSIVQILEKRDLDPYAREKLSLVGGQLLRIRGILRELVNFSRPASGLRERLALNDVVGEALSIAKYYRGAKSREVVTDIPNDLPSLVGVRGQLVQVFLNLVLNAIDATEKTGRIAITGQWLDQELMVEVADDGSGIEAPLRERLFEPYVTTKKHGTGLGLFVTRRLLADHDGRIELAERAGGGTAFRVYLPAEPVYRPSPDPSEEANVCLAAADSGR